MIRISGLKFMTTLLLCSWTGFVIAQAPYDPPYPHRTGAQLLPYCEQADIPVELLRCDYYVQGVADLATTPVQGKRLACLPKGMNRSTLLQFALDHLSSLTPQVLQENSSASLLLQAMQTAFPCPKQTATVDKSSQVNPVLQNALREHFLKMANEKQNQPGAPGKD